MLREALAGALGDDADADAVRAAAPGDAVQGVAPSLVVSPTSTAQVSAALRACHDAGATVVVRGHGTKLQWALPPERLDVVLDLSRMDALVEHARGDLVVTAQAGMSVRALHDALAPASQQLVIDDQTPLDGPGGTVGGVIGTGACGPRRLAVGSPRDLLIGVTLVRADGTIAKAGGKVVKNVAGYDLGKLLTGSLGTLAVVTEATFRLHPVPAAQRWVEARLPRADLAHALAAVIHSQLVPGAVEVDLAASDPGTARVAVLLTGTEAGVADRVDPLRDLLGDAGADTESEAESAPEWTRTLPGRAADTLLRATCVLSAVPALIDLAADLGIGMRGSAGVGVLHATLPADVSTTAAAERVARLRAFCRSHGGSLVVLRAPAELREAVDSFGPIGGLALMRRIKHEFDPTRVLAPGRFVDAGGSPA